MRFTPLLLLPVLLHSFSAPDARAWDLAVVTGFNYSHPSLNPDPPAGTTISTKSAFDFGALSAFSIGDDYFFETGLIRHSRATVLEDALSTTESRYSGWLIPLTLRFMRTPFFGFGFGPYIGVLNARTKTVTNYHAGGSVEINAGDPNRKGTEFGLHVNLRIAIPVYHDAKVVLDGSYLFGFTDLNKSGVSEDKTQDLLILVGLQIPIGTSAPASERTSSTIIPSETTGEPLAPAATPIPAAKTKKKKEKRK